MNELERLVVLDFEATCAKPSNAEWNLAEQEIIELPAGLVSVPRREVVDTFGTFVRPTRQPELTEFCTELTSIRQEDVDEAPTIDEAIESLQEWFDDHGMQPGNSLVVTCGDWDLKTMWPKQVGLAEALETPALFRRWCNLKVAYSRFSGNRRAGMMGMLRTAGIEHEGHHHRGADDVRNLCRLVVHMLEEGFAFEATSDRRCG